MVAVLEPLPKWELLVSIMEEVALERARLAASSSSTDRSATAAPVLVIAKEAHTCVQLAKVCQ